METYIKDTGREYYWMTADKNIIYDAGVTRDITAIPQNICRGYFTMDKFRFVHFRKQLAGRFKLDKTIIMHDLRIMDAQSKIYSFPIEFRGHGNKVKVALDKVQAKPNGEKDYTNGMAHWSDLVDLMISYEAR